MDDILPDRQTGDPESIAQCNRMPLSPELIKLRQQPVQFFSCMVATNFSFEPFNPNLSPAIDLSELVLISGADLWETLA